MRREFHSVAPWSAASNGIEVFRHECAGLDSWAFLFPGQQRFVSRPESGSGARYVWATVIEVAMHRGTGRWFVLCRGDLPATHEVSHELACIQASEGPRSLTSVIMGRLEEPLSQLVTELDFNKLRSFLQEVDRYRAISSDEGFASSLTE